MNPVYEDYLAHYGVKGQKHGVRRYQNEDGTLTAEGKSRYGHLQNHGDEGVIKKWTLGSEQGNYAFAKWRERRHRKNLAKAKASGNKKKEAKYQKKLDAQSAANANLAAYREHSSTKKLVGQNMLGPAGYIYRHARARGESKKGALAEALTPGVGLALTLHRNKKKYGKRIVWSGINVEDSNYLSHKNDE